MKTFSVIKFFILLLFWPTRYIKAIWLEISSFWPGAPEKCFFEKRGQTDTLERLLRTHLNWGWRSKSLSQRRGGRFNKLVKNDIKGGTDKNCHFGGDILFEWLRKDLPNHSCVSVCPSVCPSIFFIDFPTSIFKG